MIQVQRPLARNFPKNNRLSKHSITSAKEMSFQKFQMPEIDEGEDEEVEGGINEDENAVDQNWRENVIEEDIGGKIEERENSLDHVTESSSANSETNLQTTENLNDFAQDLEEDSETDLESDDLGKDHDLTGRSQYKKICEELGEVPIKYFVRHITDHCLEMKYHGLGATATKAMALVLRDSITLDKLDLQGNWLRAEGGSYMARMLTDNSYISEVNLSDNQLGSEGAAHMCQMLQRNSGLKTLDLSANELGDSDIANFVTVLEANKSLKELNLSRNRFCDIGGQILGPAIGSNDTLDVLDLSWNHFRQKGAIAIAKGIQENVHLKKCLLGWNGFGIGGGAAIADAMMVNTSILHLDICGNRLDQNIATRMAKALRMNDELQVLRMGNNPITTTGAIALAEAVLSNSSSGLLLLDLTDVQVECEFLKLVQQIQLVRPDFAVIHGPVLRVGNTRDDLGKPGVDLTRKRKPVEVHDDHIIINDLRLVDILKKYDHDGSLSITPETFTNALEELGVPYDKGKVEKAIEKLTDNNTGAIFFGCFLDNANEPIYIKDMEKGTESHDNQPTP